MDPIRTSPTQSRGFFSSLTDAYQAYRGSTQKMNPEQAIHELAERMGDVFEKGVQPNFDWLNRVNRLLWVLTSNRVVVLKQEEEQQNILRIMETAVSIHQDYGFKKVKKPQEYADHDPRKANLSFEDILVQIHGRCKVIEEAFIQFQTSEGTIQDLKNQLRETEQEERRLIEKLKLSKEDADHLKKYFQQKMEEVKQKIEDENERIQAGNRVLHEKNLRLKSDNALLIAENKRLQDNSRQMSNRIGDLEEEVERQKQFIGNTQVEVKGPIEPIQERDSSEQIKELKLENQKLSEEVQFLNSERNEVLVQYERFVNLKRTLLEETNLNTEALEEANRKLQEITQAWKEANRVFMTDSDINMNQFIALNKFLNEVELILKK